MLHTNELECYSNDTTGLNLTVLQTSPTNARLLALRKQSVNAKQLEQSVFQAEPNRCESDHGCQHSFNRAFRPILAPFWTYDRLEFLPRPTDHEGLCDTEAMLL